jgi:hypothetical protein
MSESELERRRREAAERRGDTVALRFNTGKAPLSMILDFERALEDLCEVMAQGSIKYTPKNWQLGGKTDEEYLSAAMRHMEAHSRGEVYDPDIGTKHLANAAWNMLACLRNNHPGPRRDPAFNQEEFEQCASVEHRTETIPPDGGDFDAA